MSDLDALLDEVLKQKAREEAEKIQQALADAKLNEQYEQ